MQPCEEKRMSEKNTYVYPQRKICITRQLEHSITYSHETFLHFYVSETVPLLSGEVLLPVYHTTVLKGKLTYSRFALIIQEQ